jgi:hypothetical protein
MIVRKGHAVSKTRDEPNFGVMETASFSDSTLEGRSTRKERTGASRMQQDTCSSQVA